MQQTALPPPPAAAATARRGVGVARSGQTRQALLDAAERLFAERGVNWVSMREIVRESQQHNTSAALYHFGVAIQKDQKIPVGLINSSWGGSPIEPWTVTEKGSGGMYNAMIAPISKFAVKGVICGFGAQSYVLALHALSSITT